MQVNIESASEAREKTLLVFSLSGERFAIDVDCVIEITKCSKLTSINGAPDYLLGLMEQRNFKVPVFSLKKLLFTNSPDDATGSVIVVNIKGRIIALMIETKTDIDIFSLCAGEDVVETKGRYQGWVDGVARIEGGTVFILSLSRFFESADKDDPFKGEQ